jgi:hypothetical protein
MRCARYVRADLTHPIDYRIGCACIGAGAGV